MGLFSKIAICAAAVGAAADQCDVAGKQRQDCGSMGTHQQECEAKGCCWKTDEQNVPFCFYKASTTTTTTVIDWPVVKWGNANVELAVEGLSAFRISVSYGGKPTQTASRMIAPKSVTAKYKVDSDASGAKVTTDFGSLEVNYRHGAVYLRDINGMTLSHSDERFVSYSNKDDRLNVFLAAASHNTDQKYYASGFAAGSPLEASSSKPTVGNDYGRGSYSWAPQYFSPVDKYAALAVGKNDLPRTSGNGTCIADFGRQWCIGEGVSKGDCLAADCCWVPNNDNLPTCFTKTMPSLADYPASWAAQDGGVMWTVDGSAVDIYLMPTADAYEFRRAHDQLTGAPRVLPRYAFGFMAGRYGWQDKADIEEKLNTFRNGNFPIDAFISDFEWFTDVNDYEFLPSGSATYTDFGYNNVTFPSPAEQLAKYHNMGFKFGGIRKPRLGNDKLLTEARDKGWMLPGGVNGKDRNLNLSIEAARDWYAEENNHYLKDGVDFWWNDEGEVTFFMFDEWNDALVSGWNKINPMRRFFSLNRAHTPGMQRYGLAIWTGDIAVSWQSLQEQPAMMLNAALMGMPYISCDTGGFAGGNDTAEMITRWYQIATLMSVMRVHSNNKVVPHFPFLFGEQAANAMRKALDLRYHLIPFLYSLGHHAFAEGKPIIRPLFMEFPDDMKAWAVTDQWLLGSGLMAAPILTEAPAGSSTTTRDVYFPEGTWYEFNSTTVVTAGKGGLTKSIAVAFDEIPLYVRAGTVLPLAPAGIQHTGQLGGILDIQVYTGADGSFTLVEDDGETTMYETDSKFALRKTNYIWNEKTQKLSWSMEGNFMDQSVFTTQQVRVMHPKWEAPSTGRAWSTRGVVALATALAAVGIVAGVVVGLKCAKPRQARRGSAGQELTQELNA